MGSREGVDVLITAGGGGHTGYAKAIAMELQGVRVGFIVGRGDKWSIAELKELGEIYIVERLRGPLEGLKDVAKRTPRGLIDSTRLPRAPLLVATGSNIAIIPSLVLWAQGAKVINLEAADRITTASRTTRILHPISMVTVLHWREQLKLYPYRSIVVGPVYERPKYKSRDEGYILICCGSQGNPMLVKAAVEARLRNVVLQYGRRKPVDSIPSSWISFSYTLDIQYWISRAHIVVTHPGKTVIDAALAYGKPVLLVYNPEWRLTSSPEDAKELAKILNIVFIGVPTPSKLAKGLKLAEKLRPRRLPSGAPRLARIIEQLVKEFKQQEV